MEQVHQKWGVWAGSHPPATSRKHFAWGWSSSSCRNYMCSSPLTCCIYGWRVGASLWVELCAAPLDLWAHGAAGWHFFVYIIDDYDYDKCWYCSQPFDPAQLLQDFIGLNFQQDNYLKLARTYYEISPVYHSVVNQRRGGNLSIFTTVCIHVLIRKSKPLQPKPRSNN